MKDKRYLLVLLISIIALLVSVISMSNNSFASPTTTIYTRDELSERITDNELFLKSYPVGSIYITTNTGNPGDTYGGTWVSYGNGRTLVGLDSSQTEFNTINKTGGSKLHKHEMPIGFDEVSAIYFNTTSSWQPIFGSSYYTAQAQLQISSSSFAKINSSALRRAKTDNNSSLQPYIVVNMWKRTA